MSRSGRVRPGKASSDLWTGDAFKALLEDTLDWVPAASREAMPTRFAD